MIVSVQVGRWRLSVELGKSCSDGSPAATTGGPGQQSTTDDQAETHIGAHSWPAKPGRFSRGD